MAQIVDINGKPITSEALAEPQTARTGQIYRVFEEHPARGLTPASLNRILAGAEQGDLIAQHDLFRDMEDRDGHILTEMFKRKAALQGLDWEIVPPPDATAQEKADAEWLKEIIGSLELEDIILDAMDAVGHGFSCQEITWSLVGRERLPTGFEHRPQSWFQLDQATRSQIRLRDNTADGAELWPLGWVVHVHKAKSGYVARGGIHRTLAWPYLFKNYAVRDLAEFLEIYGLPLRLGTYPIGASPKEKATLLNAVMSIGHAAAGIVPEGMAIDFKEAAKGQSDPFEAMIGWCENTQSKIILGQTLSADAKPTGLGSGVSNLHGEVRHDILAADARQVARTITRQILWPVLSVNRPGADPARCHRFRFDLGETEDLAAYAEALPKLASAGMQIGIDFAHEKLRIPKAKKGEAILGALKAPAPDGTVTPPAGPAALKREAGSISQPDAIDGLVGEALDSWEPDLTALLAPVQAALDKAVKDGETVADFQRRLADLLPKMDAAALANHLSMAAFQARLAGVAGIDADGRRDDPAQGA
ncbi:DUF935 domain-containing protein [Rhodocyclus tenuis]|uniref:Phage gp29-like protein n=1 Tax=Rhodocyclus tenuis TaxID=1066 RepID=A0A840GGC6_RHOTE|nr:DUF935 domain-containing protein [Rhodocyclus tenuis]MBB4247259.1 phage gp29-like protein [Rhodocyclus tenuis]